MSGQDMRKIMENLNTETPKKEKLNESLGGTPIANDIMELAAKLEAIQNTPVEELAEADVDEKWAGDADIKQLDKYGAEEISLADLRKKRNALRDKEERTAAQSKELKRMNFAIRSRTGWGKADESTEDEKQALEEMVGSKPWFIEMLDRDPDPADAVDFLFRWKNITEEFKAAHPALYDEIQSSEGISYFVTGYMDIQQLKDYVETGNYKGY